MTRDTTRFRIVIKTKSRHNWLPVSRTAAPNQNTEKWRKIETHPKTKALTG